MEKNNYGRAWLITESKKVLETYSSGITLRQLYYRLVAQGMPNNVKQYKNLVSAMTSARWAHEVDMEAFIDRERSMYGKTQADDKELDSEIKSTKDTIKYWLKNYHLERWSNQEYFIEVWIEKKALQGVFERPCSRMDVALAPCKGYPSLTFLNDANIRFTEQEDKGKEVIILYFGDYDPSGEDIPRSIQENLSRMGCDVKVERIALNPELIKELKLPGVPPKSTDSRTANWQGDEVVELDAVEPKYLEKLCTDAIMQYFDGDLYEELKEKEQNEKVLYQKELKKFVKEMKEE